MLDIEMDSLTMRFETGVDFEACTRDNTLVVNPATGHVTLDKTFYVGNERGDILQRRGEELNRFVWARKVLCLDYAAGSGAMLMFFAFQYRGNNQPLRIEVNGHDLAYASEGGRGCWSWHTVELPAEWLCTGENTFCFRTDGTAFNTWMLAIDNLTSPECSAKSGDSGATWQNSRMGYDGSVQGEYVVRLRLARYPAEGTIVSPVIDLAGGEIAPMQAIYALRLEASVETPDGTSVVFHVRHGISQAPEIGGWSAWRVALSDRAEQVPTKRFVQWRATLFSAYPLATPGLVSAVLCARPTHPAPRWSTGVHLAKRADRKIVRSSIPFVYQPSDEPKLATLREQERLDDVVASAECEFDRFLLLRHWVAKQWPWHGGITYSPWDALVILDWQRGTRSEDYDGAPYGFVAHGGCVHFSQVYIQCCLAVGLQARGVALDIGPPPPDRSHFVTEVWSNEHEKWIVMDPTADVHFEHQGMPLGGAEMHDLWRIGRAGEVTQVSGPFTSCFALGPTWAVDEYRAGSYRYYSIVPRNNHLSALTPSPIDHGQTAYHEDAYVWYGDMACKGQPWFSLYSTRRADFEWTLNQVTIDLAFEERPGVLRVLLATFTPNLARFEVARDGSEWREVKSDLILTLHAGGNRLEARAVNCLGVAGPISLVQVDYHPHLRTGEQLKEQAI